MKYIRIIAMMAVCALMAINTSCGVKDKALDAAVEEINKQLAEQKVPGIDSMALTVDDNYVIYNYVVDENVADISLMKAGSDVLKSELLSGIIRDPQQQTFVKLVKLSDRGMKFVYKGNKSDEEFVLVYENDEL